MEAEETHTFYSAFYSLLLLENWMKSESEAGSQVVLQCNKIRITLPVSLVPIVVLIGI